MRPFEAPRPFDTPLSPTSTLYDSEPPPEPKKLVLCFDGTGNQFSGSSGDTNVVKLLNKLDRNAPNQYHYYQSAFTRSPNPFGSLLIYSYSWNRHLRH